MHASAEALRMAAGFPQQPPMMMPPMRPPGMPVQLQTLPASMLLQIPPGSAPPHAQAQGDIYMNTSQYA